MKRQLAAALAAAGSHSVNGNGVASPSNGSFEAEREAYHAEIKKLRDHVTELHAAKAAAGALPSPPSEPKTNGHDVAQYVDRIRVIHSSPPDARFRYINAMTL
jgi:hypothetical protein